MLNDLIVRLTKLICQLYSADFCQIILLDASGTNANFRCIIKGKTKSIFNKKTRIISSFEKKIIKNLSAIQKERQLIVPMISDDIIGFIETKRNNNKPPFIHSDFEILITLAEQSVIGIRNLQLYEEHQKVVLGSIKSLVTLLDTRIPQEYTHSPYFSRLVTSIGHQMHLDQKQIESLKYASLLHDAGKIDTPPEILAKTSKLTAKEYGIIQKHPIKGAQILRPMLILKPVIAIIMHHHEKYNGTGYPSRLKKGQIPIGARIMAVADAFEAMVYGRPYRERMNINEAIKEIKKKSGTQFDPKVVESFLKVAKRLNARKYLHDSKNTI
jgi:putative nucleotidyltransferase with HDIG domain